MGEGGLYKEKMSVELEIHFSKSGSGTRRDQYTLVGSKPHSQASLRVNDF